MYLTVFAFSFLYFSSIRAWSPNNRLQRDVIPKSYSLKIVPNISANAFVGEVTILLRIDRSMRNITLNSEDLIINEIILDQASGRTGFELDKSKQLLHAYDLDREYIDPGEHILHIKFSGSLEIGNGFYSWKVRRSGEDKQFLATKFSPINARTAFPCFDEPYFKSVISLRVIKPNYNWTVLSNMKEIGNFEIAGGIAVDFQSTMPMSTYLLSWTLTNFTSLSDTYENLGRKIPLRIFTPEERIQGRKDALEVTKKSLKFFEDYTGIPYSLEKLDSIEIPYYSSRGMEHWGLIVYLENLVTRNPKSLNSPLSHRVDSMALITHEISHMWFGNLVTHEWYNDFWLTEGFARYFQYKAVSSILNEPFLELLFQHQKFFSLFKNVCTRIDPTETVSYPITKWDIYGKFGISTYDQGAAILMMIESVIGSKNFQKAIRNHLEQHKFGHATTGDFLNTIQDVAPTVNVRGFMESYLFQSRLPLILIEETNSSYVLKQMPLCRGGKTSIFGDKWSIPIYYITSGNQSSRFIWFDRDMSNVTIPKSKKDSWIKLNHMTRALYTTQYQEKNYEALRKDIKKLKNSDLGPLLEEVFTLTIEKRIPCDIPLKLIGELRQFEKLDYLTFTYASRSFSLFGRLYNLSYESLDLLRSYFYYIFEDVYHKVSWFVSGTETLDKRLLRTGVLESFCLVDHPYNECNKDVKNILAKNLTVHEDLEYIYNRIVTGMNRIVVNSTETPTSTAASIIELSNEEKKCSAWIKENITKIIEQLNYVSSGN